MKKMEENPVYGYIANSMTLFKLVFVAILCAYSRYVSAVLSYVA